MFCLSLNNQGGYTAPPILNIISIPKPIPHFAWPAFPQLSSPPSLMACPFKLFISEVIAKVKKASTVISTKGRNLLISIPLRFLTSFGMTNGGLLQLPLRYEIYINRIDVSIISFRRHVLAGWTIKSTSSSISRRMDSGAGTAFSRFRGKWITGSLNKRGFKGIADWYFWAIHNVTFPLSSYSISKSSATFVGVVVGFLNVCIIRLVASS